MNLRVARHALRTAPLFAPRPGRRAMSAAPPPKEAAPSPAAQASPREVKILMLHGYTQSGPLLRAKTRGLEKLLAKTLAPASLAPVLIYPTAPNRLLPRDIPGFLAPHVAAAAAESAAAADDDADQPDTWAWFRKDEATGTYRLLAESMAAIARAVRDARGVDAVCGFSQGGAMAGLVAAAMEPRRAVPDGPHAAWVAALREANAGRPLRFAVVYSGFFAVDDSLKWCYGPRIQTPTLHYIGSLDTIVDESRSRGLIDRCDNPVVVVHPGGHYVPVVREWVMPLAGFVGQHGREAQSKAGL